MGIDLYAGARSYHDKYDQDGLMAVISGTLEDGDGVVYSWWHIADGYSILNTVTSNHESTPEQLDKLIEFFEDALSRMLVTPTWRFGNHSGAPLSSYEKERYCSELKELLIFLRQTKSTGNVLVWSV
jgi:hypothetical protein